MKRKTDGPDRPQSHELWLRPSPHRATTNSRADAKWQPCVGDVLLKKKATRSIQAVLNMLCICSKELQPVSG